MYAANSTGIANSLLTIQFPSSKENERFDLPTCVRSQSIIAPSISDKLETQLMKQSRG
jgi:hypothetical protein